MRWTATLRNATEAAAVTDVATLAMNQDGKLFKLLSAGSQDVVDVTDLYDVEIVEEFTVTLTREQLGVIGTALMKLPKDYTSTRPALETGRIIKAAQIAIDTAKPVGG